MKRKLTIATLIALLAIIMTACSTPFGDVSGTPVTQSAQAPVATIRPETDPTAIPTAAATAVPMAAPTAAPTTIAQPTQQASGVTTNPPPFMFDAQSCDPEQSPDGGCSWDVGTKGIDQVTNKQQFSLAFGVDISWPQGGPDFAADPNSACEIVALGPNTWFEDMNVKDARVEVYDVSMADYPGWINVLAVQRVQEQSGHYGCPATRSTIPFWTIIDGKPTVQQLMLKPLVGGSATVSADNSVVTPNGSMTVDQCKVAYAQQIAKLNTPAITTVDQALAILKANGVSYDAIDPVRVVKDGGNGTQITGLSIASATNLRVPFPLGLGTDASANSVKLGMFKPQDLGGGNSLNSDVTLSGGFGGTIWFSVQNYENFCGPNAQINQTAQPSSAERQTTGQNQSLTFTAGTPVVGLKIVLDDGTTYGECYLADPKMGGTVTSGVLNPWDTEVASANVCQ